jgi:hypothetical protein
MLPKYTRDRVWELYVPDQDPTPEYLRYTAAVIDWLANKEGTQ